MDLPVQSLNLATGPALEPGELFNAIMPWLLVLLAIVVIGWIILVILRRSSRGSGSLQDDGFTLGQLRRMHNQGELTDEEFEQARIVILGHHAKSRSPDQPPESDTPGGGEIPPTEP